MSRYGSYSSYLPRYSSSSYTVRKYDFTSRRQRERENEKPEPAPSRPLNLASFSPEEWRLQRRRERSKLYTLDQAFDKALERSDENSQRWRSRFETGQSEIRKLEDSCRSASVVTPRPSTDRQPEVARSKSVAPPIHDRKPEVKSHQIESTQKIALPSDGVGGAETPGKHSTTANDSEKMKDESAKTRVRSKYDSDLLSIAQYYSVSTTYLRKDVPKDVAKEDAVKEVSKEEKKKKDDPPKELSQTKKYREVKTPDSKSVLRKDDRTLIDAPAPSIPVRPPKISLEKPEVKKIVEIKREKTPVQSRKTPEPTMKIITPKTARKQKFKQMPKKDWLEPDKGELASDAMVQALQCWITSVKESLPDPLGSLKGKAQIGIRVGTRPIDPYVRLRDEVYTYRGEVNFYGKPHGKGVVTYENGDQFSGEFRDGYREGPGTLKTRDNPIRFIDGVYNSDKLEGKGKIEYSNGDVLYSYFNEGALHGLAMLFDKEQKIKTMCWYSNGIPTGLMWKFLIGGGYLYGEVDMTGNLIGDEIAFIYPDLKTALFGTFVKGKMIMAQTCFLQLVSKRSELCHLKFTKPRGPPYSFDPATRDRICEDPLLPDPYESIYVYVKTSRIKGASEGLFAKKDLPKDIAVSFYNGIRMRSDELDDDIEDWEKNAYKIMDLMPEDENGVSGILDIPEEFISIRKYRASLCHKSNHSFQPNSTFLLFDHPRFGLLPSLVTLKEIKKDEEITVSYDYNMDEAPPWYQDLYTQRMLDSYRKSRFDFGVL